ncbi:hypothetical protein AVEN_222821-1 [Araneus ventricosus]|uniref:Uncharacterized protein n=1 Tax=Araneus ventricosus TaxID=182803 RepID=A0A4Y2GZA4_ARAVE|nr:hypothetical protein AVEN_222821-1 [Araneus ventricosus]
MCQTQEDTNSATSGVSSLLLQEGPYPAKPCGANCMKEDCSHDDLLFLCLCPQHTSERECIGPENIAVGHQSNGTTYYLRMSLDLTSRTIPKGNDMARAEPTSRVRWRFRRSLPISRRNSTPFCAAFYRCNGYRRDIYG